jgi:hypothetical protein
MNKGKIFSKFFLKAFYGLDMEPERNRNSNLSKDGTGTVKNGYSSTTLIEVEPCTGVGILDVVEDPLHDLGEELPLERAIETCTWGEGPGRN